MKNSKVPIIIKKIEAHKITIKHMQTRVSRKMQTTEHVIRELTFNRKSFY